MVDAGRIAPAVGERLSQIAPGQFCLHKAWGPGKVISWDLPGGKVTIDFASQPGHQEMGLKLALQKTEYLAPDDFRSKKVEEIETLRDLAKQDATAVVVHLLESHGGTMSIDALEKELSGAVVAEADFKRWWEQAKKELRESKRVVVPTKRTEPLILRSGGLTPAQALVSDFEQARELKSMAKALEAISGDLKAFANEPETLKRLLVDIDEAARKGTRLQLGAALELLVIRDEMIGASKTLELDPTAVRLCDVLTKESDRVADAVAGMAASRQRGIYENFPAAFGDEWVDYLTKVFDKVGARGVAEIARMLEERGELEALEAHLQKSLARRGLGPDALIWVCRERKGIASNVFNGEVGAAILTLLENDHIDDGPRRAARLQTAVMEDRELLGDLVTVMDSNEARNFGRRLLECPVFNELDKKSLMARVVKARPETIELVNGQGASKKEENLIVSWESLERKKAELDDIIRNRIPQNTKDISIARSYGDLRENFEYKSAKDMQKVLMRRKGELEREVDRARGTDFKGSDASQVNIGTIVTLRDESGAEKTYTVLGAWDSNPETSTLSYLSEIGAALMGRKPGEATQIRDLETERMVKVTVQSVSPYIA